MKHSIMTRMTSALFAVLMVVVMIPATVFTAWGEALDDFTDYLAGLAPEKDNVTTFIYTADDLDKIREDLDGFYILMNDIDLTNREWVPIGDKDTPFTGILLGGGYTIKGISLSLKDVPMSSDGFYYVGLFGCNQGIIRDLKIMGEYADRAEGYPVFQGAFAGYNAGKILNCHDGVKNAAGAPTKDNYSIPVIRDLDQWVTTPQSRTFTVGDDSNTIILKGSGKEYYNFRIVISNTASSLPVQIVLINVHLTNFEITSSAGRSVNIISMGESNSISAKTGKIAIDLPQSDLGITGTAPLTINGYDASNSEQGYNASTGKGNQGAAGMIAVSVKKLNVFMQNPSAVVAIIGGNGGKGGTGKDGTDKTGETGEAGGTGYQGGLGGTGAMGVQAVAINAQTLLVVQSGDGGQGGTGGTGGDGAQGTHGKNDTGMFGGDGGDGGKGGDGGAGGIGGNGGTMQLPISSGAQVKGNVQQIMGDAGAKGEGAYGGAGGAGGTGGTGGWFATNGDPGGSGTGKTDKKSDDGNPGTYPTDWRTKETVLSAEKTVYKNAEGQVIQEVFEEHKSFAAPITVYSYHEVLAAELLRNSPFRENPSGNYVLGSEGVTEYGGALYYGTTENPYAVLVRWIATESTTCEIHPDTEYIYSHAFYNAEGQNRLATVTIPKSVDAIGKYAFANCKYLTRVIAEDTLVDVGARAFENCVLLKSVEWQDAPKQGLIPNVAFNQMTAQKDGKLRIGEGIFAGCKVLPELDIPNGVTEIPANACKDAGKLRSVDIPASVTKIGDAAFEECHQLTDVNFAKDAALASIGNTAFKNCYALEQIELCAALETIGTEAFANNSALKSLYLPAGVQSIGTDAFYHCPALQSIEVAAENTAYLGVENCLVEALSGRMILGCVNSDMQAANKTEAVIKSIGAHSFVNIAFSSPVAIPHDVTMEDAAFASCSGEMIVLPSTHNPNAFEACTDGSLFTYADVPEGAINQYKILLDGRLGEHVYYVVYQTGNESVVLVYGKGATYNYQVENVLDANQQIVDTEVWLLDENGQKDSLTTLLSQQIAGSKEITERGCWPKHLIVRNGVDTLGTSVFYGMESYLESVQLGEGIKKISAKAFDFSGSMTVLLRNVTFEGDCPLIDKDAFLFNKSAVAQLANLLVFTYDKDATGWTYNGNPYLYYVQGQGLVTEKPSDPSLHYFMVSSSEDINYVNTAGYDKYGIQYEALGQTEYKADGMTKVVYTAKVVGYKRPANGGDSIQIPLKILMDGDFYYVTTIAEGAFKENGNLAQITVQTDTTDQFDQALEDFGYTGISKIFANAFTDCAAQLYFVGDKPATVEVGAFAGMKYIVINPDATTNNWGVLIDDAQIYISHVLNGFTDQSGMYYTVDLQNKTAIVGKKTKGEESVTNTSMSKQTNVVIPEFVTYNDRLYMVVGFDRYAFYNNKSLETIKLGRFIGQGQSEAAPAIWDCTFRNTERLWQIEVDFWNEYYTVEHGALLGNPLNPDGDEAIFTRLIKYPEADNKPTLLVPDTVTVVENYAVAGNPHLKAIRMIGVNVIGSHAFWNCTALATLDGEYQLHDIGDSAFENTAITQIKFTDALARIGTRAFHNSKLTGEIELSTYVIEIGASAFGRCTEITGFRFIDFGSGDAWKVNYSEEYWTEDGVLFGYTETDSHQSVKTLLQYPAAKQGVEIYDMSALPEESVPVAIATEAFWGAEHLTQILMHDQTKLVGSQAFSNCGRLTYVKLGESYRGSGDESTGEAGIYSYNLFVDSPALEQIEVAEQNAYFCHDSNGVLFSKALDVLYCYPAAVQRVDYRVPASVTKIYDSAFYGNTNIKQVVINTTSEQLYVGSRAFGSCSNLTEVYYVTGTAPAVGEKIYDNTPMGMRTLYKEEYAAQGWKNAAMTGKWCERDIVAYRAIEEVPNGTLETNDYLFTVVGTDGKPLEDVYVIITTYVSNETVGAWVPHKFYLHTDDHGQVVFSTLAAEGQIDRSIHVYATKEGYFPFDYDMYIDTEMLISYLTLTKEPDVFGISCEDKDIQSQTVDINLALRQAACGIASFVNGEFLTEDGSETFYEDIPITVLGFWDTNCTDPVFTLMQGDRVLPTTQEINGAACTFIVSTEHLVAAEPLRVTISVKHGEETLEMTKTLNINVKNFSMTAEDLDVDVDESVSLPFIDPDLAALLGVSSFDFKLGKNVEVGVTLEESLVKFKLGIKKTWKSSTSTAMSAKEGYEKYYKQHGSGTYFWKIRDVETGLTYAIRFAPSDDHVGYVYFRLHVYPTTPGARNNTKDTEVVYGAFNMSQLEYRMPKDRTRFALRALSIRLAASEWLAKQGRDNVAEILKNGGRVDLTDYKPLNEKFNPNRKELGNEENKGKGPMTTKETSHAFSIGIEGELAVGFDEENKPYLASGQVKGYISYKFEHNIQTQIITPVVVIPIVVSIEFTAAGELEMSFKPDPEGNWGMDELAARIKADFEVSAGIGCSIVSGGVYGTIGFVFQVQLLPDLQIEKATFTGTLGLYFKVEIAFFKYNYKLELIKGEFDCLTGKWTVGTIADKFKSSLFLPESYGYAVDCARQAQLAYVDGELYQFYFAPVSDGAHQAQYDEYNCIKLMYAVYDADTDSWSEGQILEDNGLSDASFELFTQGQKTYIIYTQQSKKLTKDTASDTYAMAEGLTLKCVEACALLNGAEPQTVLDGKASSEYKYLSQAGMMGGSPIVAWAENADNNIFGTSPDNYYDEQTGQSYVFATTANSIHYAKLVDGKWVEQTYVIEGLSAVTDMALDGSVLYYVIDTDGDLTDSSDSVLYRVDLADESHTTTTVSGVSAVDCTGGALTYYYASENCLASPDAQLSLPQQGKFSGGYVPIADENGEVTAVLYQSSRNMEVNGEVKTCSVICAVLREGDAWGAPVIVYDAGQPDRYVSGYEAIRHQDGGIMLALQICDADGNTLDHVTELYDPSEIRFDYSYEIDYENQEIIYTVTNLGGQSATFSVENGEGVEIASGESAELIYAMNRKIKQTEATLLVTAVRDGVAPKTLEKGEVSTSYSDLMPLSKQLVFGEDNTMLIGVRNLGNALSQGGTLYVISGDVAAEYVLDADRAQKLTESAICSIELPEIGAGRLTYFEIRIDEALVRDGDGAISLFVVPTGTEPEACIENNLGAIYLDEITQTTYGEQPAPAEPTPEIYVQDDTYYKSEPAISQTGIGVLVIGKGEVALKLGDLTLTPDSAEQTGDYGVVVQGTYSRTLHVHPAFLNQLALGEHTFTVVIGNEEISFAVTVKQPEAAPAVTYTVTFNDGKTQTLFTLPEQNEAYALFFDSVPAGSTGFLGWDGPDADSLPDEFVYVTEDTVYTAVYEQAVVTYVITFVLADGMFVTKSFEKGSIPACPQASYQGKLIRGWKTAENDLLDTLPAVSGPATYYAAYAAKANDFALSGSPSVGGVLQADLSSLDWEDLADLTYQWYLDGVSVPKANTDTFSVTGEMKGKTVWLIVTAQDGSIAESVHYTVAQHGHTMFYTPYTAPTCTVGGNVEYWFCPECDKCFTDVDCTQIVDANQVRIEPTGHRYGAVVTPPTCLTQGYTTHACENCDYLYVDTYIEATGHKMSDWTQTKAPTCTENGIEVRACTNGEHCKYNETRTVAPTGHTYTGKWTVDVEATCVNAGSKSQHCTVCDYKHDVTEIKILPHSMSEWSLKKAPTCTENGVEVRACTNGEHCKYNETRTVAPTGHTYTDKWTVDVEATCVNAGSKSQHCTVCDYKHDVTEIKMLPHDLSDWTQTKAPTCTENGLEKRECAHCDYNETRTVAPTGHTYTGEWTVDVEATCVNAGSKSQHCTVCDYKHDVTEIKMLPHDLSDWTQTKAPTCTENGLEKRECAHCDYNETRTVAPTGHTYTGEWTVDVEATCVNAGSKSQHCTVCDYKHDVIEIKILPHSMSEWLPDKAPTCVKNGLEKRACAHCDYNETRTVEALGHVYTGEWTVDLEATCVNAGSKSQHCTVCEFRYNVTVIEILPHDLSDWAQTKAPTCTENGLEKRECAHCDYNETRTVVPTGHTYTGEWTVDVEATCTAAGSKSQHCTVCEFRYNVTVIEILPHDLSDWTQTKAPTCTENGLEKRECARCDYNETKTIDALGHDFADEWTEDVASTCSAAGRESRHCARCDAVTDIRSIALVAHSFDEGEVTTPAEPDREGVLTVTCRDCGHAYTQSIEKIAPQMVEQSTQVWESWSKKDELVFRSNAAFEDFVELRINGEVVPTDCYTVIEGSIKIVLDPEYVASLENGDYKVDIVSKSGVASSSFQVDKKLITNPWMITGSITALVLSVAAAVIIIMIRKRRMAQ